MGRKSTTETDMSAVKKVEEPTKVQLPAVATPMELIDRAMTSGSTPETLEKLLALQERWEKNQARRAFDAAVAMARGEIKPVIRTRGADFGETKRGAAGAKYRYETLGDIATAVDPILAKNGLSYRYRTKSEPNQPISVTCVLAHRDGHFEETTLSAGADGSGGKNSIQAIGSTVTYLQRYTLKAALGLAAAYDDDGKKGDEAVDTSNVIDEKQLEQLQRAITDTKLDVNIVLEYYNVPSLADLPAAYFDKALKKITARKK